MEDAFDKIMSDPNSGFVKPGEKKEEVQPEENKEEVQKSETQETQTQETQTQTPEEKPWEFNLEGFNKKYGLNFENEDNLKSFFEKGSKTGELETELQGLKDQIPYYQKVEETLRQLADQYNPEKVYGSKEAYRDAILINKLKEGKNEAIVTSVVKGDLYKMPDMEVLTLKKKFDSPSIVGETEAIKRSILKKVGVDIDGWEADEDNAGKRFDVNNVQLTGEQRVELSSLADQARSELNGLRSNVEVPEYKDPLDGLKEQVKQDQESIEKNLKEWENKGERIADELSKLQKFKKEKGEDGNEKDVLDFEYEIESSFKSDIKQMVVDYIKEKNLEPTQENVDAVKRLVKYTYLTDNFDKILDAYGSERESRVTQKVDKEVENNQPINKEEPPPAEQQTKEDEFNRKVSEWFKH